MSDTPILFASRSCGACIEALRFVQSRPDIQSAISIRFVETAEAADAMRKLIPGSSAVPTLLLDGKPYRGEFQISQALKKKFPG
jgi:glutaredoxin